MEAVRRAVIDVGTNSVKLLVADVSDHQVRPVFEASRQTRLGRGFFESRRLQPEPIANTAKAIAEFASQALEQGATAVRVIATSAAREAVNGRELTSAIEQASGLRAEVISGEQEANLVFQGVTTDPELASQPLLIVEVGGGSTELILGQRGEKQFQQTLPLGTVRLMSRTPWSDPPTLEECSACLQRASQFLREEMLLPRFSGHGHQAGNGVQLVGTGGTASILGCMEAQLQTFDRARLEATRLSLGRIRWHVNHLWSLPLEARRQVVGLPPNRADVILTGVVIYQALLEVCGFGELRISTRGLRFGAILDAR